MQQCNRLVDTINKALEGQKYCSAVFLDVSQAFDKVWHPGLLLKIKKTPTPWAFSTTEILPTGQVLRYNIQ